MTTATATVYEDLKDRCLGSIEAYQNDLLVHDRTSIEEHPDRKFLHWTRSAGTWLWPLYETHELPDEGVHVPYLFGSGDRRHIARGTLDVAQACQRDGDKHHVLVHHYDGKRLRRINCAEATDIAQRHYYRLLAEWERENKRAR